MAYNIGQLVGLAILLAIAFGIFRDVSKKRAAKRGDDGPPEAPV